MTYPQKPRAHGDVFINESDVVLPSPIQVLDKGVGQHVEGALFIACHRQNQKRGCTYITISICDEKNVLDAMAT